MKNTRRRSDLDIQADILKVVRLSGGARKTHVVYGANLNFKIVKGYLEGMLKAGLLVKPGPYYFTTMKAEAFLENYEALRRRSGLGGLGWRPLLRRPGPP